MGPVSPAGEPGDHLPPVAGPYRGVRRVPSVRDPPVRRHPHGAAPAARLSPRLRHRAVPAPPRLLPPDRRQGETGGEGRGPHVRRRAGPRGHPPPPGPSRPALGFGDVLRDGGAGGPSSLHPPGHPVPRSRDRQPLLPPLPVPDAERDPDTPAGDRIDPVPARRVRHRPPGVPAPRRDHESPPPAGPPRAGDVLRQLQLPRRRHREPADRAPLRNGAEGGLPRRHHRAPRRRAATRRDGASHGRVRRPAPRIEGEGSGDRSPRPADRQGGHAEGGIARRGASGGAFLRRVGGRLRPGAVLFPRLDRPQDRIRALRGAAPVALFPVGPGARDRRRHRHLHPGDRATLPGGDGRRHLREHAGDPERESRRGGTRQHPDDRGKRGNDGHRGGLFGRLRLLLARIPGGSPGLFPPPRGSHRTGRHPVFHHRPPLPVPPFRADRQRDAAGVVAESPQPEGNRGHPVRLRDSRRSGSASHLLKSWVSGGILLEVAARRRTDPGTPAAP